MKHIYMHYNYVGVINVYCMYKYIQHTYKYICILDKCNMQTNKYVKHICTFSHIDCILLSKYTTYVSLKYIQTNTLFFPVVGLIISNKLDFISCADKDGFRKSSHK